MPLLHYHFEAFWLICGALCLTAYVGEYFMPALLLQFILCKLLDDSVNRNALLAITLGGTFIASCSISSIIPTIWEAWSNIIYLFLSTNFLLHHFFWCLLEFRLLAYDVELIRIFMHTSLPALCCFIVTRTISFWTAVPFSPLICLTGFCTLRWCENKRQTNSRCTEKRLEQLQLLLTNLCAFLLLRISPCLSYFINVYFTGINEGMFNYTVEIILLICGTQFLSLSLNTAELRAKQGFHKPLGLISLSCSIVVILRRVDFWILNHIKPMDLSWFLVSILAFIGILISVWIQTSQPQHKLFCQTLSIFFGAVVCASSAIASSRFPKLSSIFPWCNPIHNLFSWNLVVCTTCSVLPLIFYQRFHEHLMQVVLEVFFSTFYVAEWNLFHSLVLDEFLFLGSSGLLILSLLGYYLLGDIRDQRKLSPTLRFLISRDFLTTCLIAPALTKLLLVGFHYLQFTPDHSSSVEFATNRSLNFRIRCSGLSVLGIFLMFFGLLSGDRVMKCIQSCCLFNREKLAASLSLPSAYLACGFKTLGLLAFMHCSLSLFWPLCAQILFGWTTSHRLAQLPVSILLTGLSLWFSCLSTQSDLSSTLDASEWLPIAHGFILLGSFLLFAISLLGLFHEVTFSLLASLLVIPLLTTLLICSLRDWAYSQSIRFKVSTFVPLIPSIRFGIVGGCTLCTLLSHLSSLMVDYWTLFLTIVYATCASQLWYGSQHLRSDMRVKSSASGKPVDNSFVLNGINSMFIKHGSIRLKLIFFLVGSLSVGSTILLQFYRFEDVDFFKTVVIPSSTIAVFLLGQLSTGRLQHILMDSPYPNNHTHDCCSVKQSKLHRRKQPLLDSENSKHSIEHRLLVIAVNISVILSIASLTYGFSLNFNDIRILFLPWLLFGLVCSSTVDVTIFPLCGFTLTLLSCLFSQSHFMASYHPPLPTFTRQWFRPSYSPWLLWTELPLTLALIPVHIVFLLHHACVSPISILHRFLTYFGSNASAYADYLAHCISMICSFVSLSTYALTLCCLTYLLFASSAASAIFGLYTFFVCCYLIMWVDVRTKPLYSPHS